MRTEDPTPDAGPCPHPLAWAKYTVDRVLAALLLIIFSPLFLGVAALVFSEGRGGIFFRQARLGQGGRHFEMWKFRTMDAAAASPAPPPGGGKPRNDPRVSRLGAFLRRSSLDELPQLLNVLKGEMSLIGPRPLPPAEALLLPPALVARRGLMRPGMTGLWQVSGRSLIPTLEARLALDLHYVDNWSPGLDLLIAVKTVPAVLSGRGAW